MIDFVRLNNRVMSAKSLSITIAEVPYQGIVAADYAEKLEKELVYDADKSGGPVGMTYGKYGAEQSTITMLKDVFTTKFLPQMAIMSAANLAPGAWAQALPFPVSFSYIELPLIPCIDLLEGCEIVAAKDTYAEGINAALVVLTVQPMIISRNGQTMPNRARSLL